LQYGFSYILKGKEQPENFISKTNKVMLIYYLTIFSGGYYDPGHVQVAWNAIRKFNKTNGCKLYHPLSTALGITALIGKSFLLI